MNVKLIPKAIMEQLVKNRQANDDSTAVLKLFTPDAQCTWLITMIEEDGDTMWGLADLGFGLVEYGTVSLKEIMSVRGRLDLPIERDRSFKPVKIADYRDKTTLAGV
jgi:hypothetical protein